MFSRRRHTCHVSRIMRPHRGLRHVVWFEFLGGLEKGSELLRIVQPGFFLIRLADHYMLAGVEMVQPESVSTASIRRFLDEMPEGHAHRKLKLSADRIIQSARSAWMRCPM